VPVDKGAVEQFRDYLRTLKEGVRQRLTKYADLDPDSNRSVATLLFDVLKLPPQKETKMGKASTDAESLKALEGKHPVVADILEWRRLSKLDGTYATGILPHICPDGRIHPNLLLDGARSGRMSCSEPNMQNIPRDADSVEGKMIRRCFAAAPGHLMVNVDYSQLEYRIAAMLSGDEAMIGVFERGEDVHLGTAKLICKMVWGIEPDAVQKMHRTFAKTTNFALLYGMGDPALASRLGCSLGVARRVREAVLGRYPKLRRWIEERVRETARTGYAWTWWAGEKARRRSLYRVADRDGDDRVTAEHSSYNSPVQGTGSDFLLASMAAVIDWIIGDGVPAVVCVPIHDALLMEVREDAVDEVVNRTKAIMTSWDSQGVPIVVDAEVGLSWGDLHKV